MEEMEGIEEMQDAVGLEVPMVRELKFGSFLKGSADAEPGIMYVSDEATLTIFEGGAAVYSVGRNFARMTGVDKYSNSSPVWSMYDPERNKVYLAVQKGKGRLEMGEIDTDTFLRMGPNNLTRLEILGTQLEGKGYRPVGFAWTSEGYLAEYVTGESGEKRAVIKDGQIIEELTKEEVQALLRGKKISQDKISRLMRSLGFEE